MRRLPTIVITSAILFAFSPVVSAVQLPGSPAQSHNEHQFGQCVADVGDVDGDGKHDLAISAPGNEVYGRTPGTVFVYSGASGALLSTLTGKENGDCFGVSIAGLGDIDGDERSDFAISASSLKKHGKAWDANDIPRLNGYVQVHSGRTHELLFRLEAPDAGFGPGKGTDLFGWRVVNAGDLDADGRADFAVAAPGDLSYRVYLFSSATHRVIRSLSGRSTFGYALVCVGDTNGDRIADLAIATPFGVPGAANHGSGYVEIFSGADGSVLRTIHGAETGEQFGRVIAGGVDLDRDGVPDLLVGALHDAIRLFSGASGAPLVFPVTDASSATPLACAFRSDQRNVNSLQLELCVLDDLDGDGSAELLAADPNHEQLELFSIRPPCRRLDTIALPGSTALLFGTTLCALNDVNDDGVPDFAVGAPFGPWSEREERNGRAWIYSGLDRKILHAFAQPQH